MLLFVFVIGGLYGLPFLPRFTPTEAGGVGATGAFLIGVITGRLDKEKILASLLQATRTAAAVFTVLIGALIFGYFLTVTQTPQKVTEFLTGLGLGSYGVLALIMLMYLVLGCLMDAMAMIILTVPIIFPVISHLGFDPIWFGVIIVMTVELGLIHPPVGMNVFVIKSVVKDVSFATIFKGVIPFVATDLVRLVILIVFPLLATWLPQRMMVTDLPESEAEVTVAPALETRYVFTITAHIGGVTSAGDIGHGVRRIIPIIGGEVRGEASTARSARSARTSRSFGPTT